VQIIRLALFQFRNIGKLEIYPSGGVSLFFGRNGQGKTNLLEAIYLLGFGKSFRTATPKDCIQQGHDECRIEGTVKIGSLTRDLKISISKTEKKLFLLGKPAPLDEFVGNLHLLAFTYTHLNVVRGGPADRRAFLDRAMAILYPGHVGCLAAYGRALKQRNKIMSSSGAGGDSMDDRLLDSWDEAMIKPGARILWNRLRYVELMKKELPQGLFGEETLKMHYLSTIRIEECDLPQIEEQFRQRLMQVRSYDRKIGSTTVGPHRDDLKLFVNGKSLIDFGSAGQQRSSLLALYFSQMEIHNKVHGFYPIFLVDDAEAELDEIRLATFLDYLSHRTQTFLTSAKEFLLSSAPQDASRFEVQNGCISRASTLSGADRRSDGNRAGSQHF
jgi:DNA replication and repair protein RecF